jgi:hypothetical protein
MGILIPELIIESVFRDGIDLIRKHPEKLDDLLGVYNTEWLEQQYGQKTINRIKTHIAENPIPIFFSWSDVPSNVPCITISSYQNDELQEDAYLNDYGWTEDTDTDPEVITTVTAPTSYNTITGWLEFNPATANITSVNLGHLFKDGGNTTYTLYSIIDETTRKAVNVGTGQSPDLINAGSFIGHVDFYRERFHEVMVEHQLSVSIHTEDPFYTKNLNYLLQYLLLSEKTRITQRGFMLSTFNSTEFARDQEKLPEHIYTQSIEVWGRTCFSWKLARETIANNVGGQIKVPKDIYPREGGDTLTVTTSDESQWDDE